MVLMEKSSRFNHGDRTKARSTSKRSNEAVLSEDLIPFAWVWEQRQREDLLPSNPLAKAVAYAHEREGPLRVFLGDAAVLIDTNHLERALRVIPMGRKNWNFCWTELGARHVGTLQSLLTTCRLQGVNPHTYLVDVLHCISRHPARNIIALTPRVWKERFAHAPLTSDVERHAC